MLFGKPRKGSDTEEIGPEIIGYIIFALFIILIISFGGQGIAKLFDEACKKFGIFCASGPQDDKTSIQSYTALICATNTVMSGQIYDSDECLPLYVTPEAADEALSKETSEKAEVVKDVKCEERICCLRSPEAGYMWVTDKECGGSLREKNEVCEKRYGPNPGPKCKAYDKAVVDCREGQKKQVTCQKCSVPPYGPLRMLPIVADTNEKAQEKCRKEAEKRLKGSVEEGNAKLAKAEDCREEDIVKSCRVLGFNLPDDLGGFASPKEFIYGAGNPSYIVYYESFPFGEDASWKSFSSWWSSATQVVLWLIPADFLVKRVGKVVASPVTKVISATKGTRAGKVISRTYGNIKQSLSNMKDEAFLMVGISRKPGKLNRMEAFALKSRLLKNLYKIRVNDAATRLYPTFKDFAPRIDKSSAAYVALAKGKTDAEVMDVIRTRYEISKLIQGDKDLASKLAEKSGKETLDLFSFMNKGSQEVVAKEVLGGVKYDSIKKTMLYFGITSIASYLGKLHECEELKGTPIGGNMLLMKALKCDLEELQSKDFDNPTEIIDTTYRVFGTELGKPIVLNKGTFYGTGYGSPPVPFYLASPCNADMKIESKPVKCYSYSHDSITGETRCDIPDLGPIEDQSSCADFSSENNAQDIMSNFLEDNEDRKRLFIYVNEKMEMVRFPHIEELGAQKEPGETKPSRAISIRSIQPLADCKPYERPEASVANPISPDVEKSIENPIVIEKDTGDRFTCYGADIYFGEDKIDTVDPATALIPDPIIPGATVYNWDTNYFICADNESHLDKNGKPRYIGGKEAQRPIDKFYRPPYFEENDRLNISTIESYCIVKSQKFSENIRRKAMIFFSNAKRNDITAGEPDNYSYEMIFELYPPGKGKFFSEIFSFTDNDIISDGVIDTVTAHKKNLFQMGDADADGKVDIIAQTYLKAGLRQTSDPSCTVDAVVVSVDKKDTKPNFCYSREDILKQTAHFVKENILIILSSPLGPIAGPYAWVARGIQAAIAWYGTTTSSDWPN